MKVLSGGRLALAAACVMSVLPIAPAHADVAVHIDKSSQRMSVSVDGAPRYKLASLDRTQRLWHPERRLSSADDGAALVFEAILQFADAALDLFYYGFAIHGTYDIHRLGGPASHVACGCTRRMRQCCTRWLSATGAATPGSSSRTSLRRNRVLGASRQAAGRPLLSKSLTTS